ncbi:DUF3667 domain-containing protein [Novosphingobium cyanobacteriorum]|uniref:DUF3667 domain-containing protein n=1 Tax=Novosphingobium cyanobacteriorum TaxID=3024215 RepID=A0ABT6CG96_9SPHN|nr:DUF3667 domain-containing protein [Novosphingobium cyanobacteriorum]MDF8332949.1 DUF3667 domain-containing protein [Novosphingobium cyanobacteriorum]
MNDGQVLGEAVQAGLTARVVEPHAGEDAAGDAGHTHESACLNCGTPLVGSHCHACGQAAHVHRTLGAFFHDLLHGVFHFEGKIWRTLPMLAWRPGDLTRRYIAGQRASFVSPLALFLFSAFLFFAVFHQTAGETEFNPEVTLGMKDGAKGEAAVKAKIADLQKQRAAAVKAGQDIDGIDRQIDTQTTALDIMHEVKAHGTDEGGKISDVEAVNHAFAKIRANPGLAAYKAQSYAYKYSWALIPISVPFLWLLFPFSRRFHLYDHTVFVTYSIAFMTLLGCLIMLLGALNQDWAVGLLLLAPPVHMYRQLRGAYGCSRAGGLVRAAALSLFAFVALLLFTMLVAVQTGT